VAEPEAGRPAGASLEAVNLTFAYPGRPPALENVSLRVEAGERLALLGQNGAGKTTLAKHFNGLLRPDSGRVLIDDAECSDLSIGQLARSVGYVFQNPDRQIFAGTTREEIAFGPRNLGLSQAEVDARVGESLDSFGLLKVADLPPAMLGYGTRRKVALASILAMRQPVLILDEPTSGLDRRSVVELMAWLDDYAGEGRTVVVITHDLRLVAEYIPRCAVLHEGELLAVGDTHDVLSSRAMMQTTGLALPPVGRLARSLGMDGERPPLDVPSFRRSYLALRARYRGAMS
jgi:energy-coupling factor transporter ATP-binding protein EcfA2